MESEIKIGQLHRKHFYSVNALEERVYDDLFPKPFLSGCLDSWDYDLSLSWNLALGLFNKEEEITGYLIAYPVNRKSSQHLYINDLVSTTLGGGVLLLFNMMASVENIIAENNNGFKSLPPIETQALSDTSYPLFKFLMDSGLFEYGYGYELESDRVLLDYGGPGLSAHQLRIVHNPELFDPAPIKTKLENLKLWLHSSDPSGDLGGKDLQIPIKIRDFIENIEDPRLQKRYRNKIERIVETLMDN